LRFDKCNKYFFEIELDHCILNLSSFYQRDLKNVKMNDCSLLEVDFTETNLKGFQFLNCDLNGAVFQQSNLQNADFRTASNYTIDPEKNTIQKAKFSQSGIGGLLKKYQIVIE